MTAPTVRGIKLREDAGTARAGHWHGSSGALSIRIDPYSGIESGFIGSASLNWEQPGLGRMNVQLPSVVAPSVGAVSELLDQVIAAAAAGIGGDR